MIAPVGYMGYENMNMGCDFSVYPIGKDCVFIANQNLIYVFNCRVSWFNACCVCVCVCVTVTVTVTVTVCVTVTVTVIYGL